MTLKEFSFRMSMVLEYVKFFTLAGYHVNSSLSLDCFMCECNVFYQDDDDLDFILRNSTLNCTPKSSDDTKWVTMV